MPTACGQFLMLAQRPPKAFVREDVGMAVDVVTLDAGGLTSRWVPSVGMVGVSLFHQGRELLGQRRGLNAHADQGSTFGIPLLHPFANRLGGFTYSRDGVDVTLDAASPHVRTEERGLPMHGLLAAASGWRVREVGARTLSAGFAFDEPDLLAAFPFPHHLALDIALEPDRLTVTTTLTPTSDRPVPVAFGFHPYLTIPGIAREDVVLRTPAMTRLGLDARGLPDGSREPQGARDAPLGETAYDDHFTDLGDAPAVVLAGRGREITMQLVEGYTHLQLFAPASSPVVAIEPMTAAIDGLRTGAGLRSVTEPLRATFAIKVRATGS
jgi:galactose mutarotase-like enzyme